MASREIIYNTYKYNISYEIHNNTQKDTIIFLHGWGSNKEIMRDSFSKYFKRYKQIFIDLPGFGNSSSNIPLDTQEYCNIIDLFLNSLHGNTFESRYFSSFKYSWDTK